ncbi:MAG: carboxypeptidase-like regulatory domain-containing protein, partial [Blastocatellia bacterium]
MHTQPHTFFNHHHHWIAREFTRLGTVYISSLLAFVLLLALAPVAAGQGATATLKGIVTDPQGAVVPGATITVSNGTLGIRRQTTTNSQGNYTVPQLPPAAYLMKVEASGFAGAEITNLVLQVGQQATQNVSLSVKGRNEIMIVETGGQLLTNTENAEIGEVIENKRIIELPLNGRQFTQLIALTPGIGSPAGGTPRNELTGGFDNANFTINGARETDNYYT